VLQKNHIFEGSIEENIRYGKPEATDAEVIEAAKKAFIYDQVMSLPKGFQSQATALSGGQQQRIAIARMFLKNPPIIFLDEPTASLDAVATEQIKASIDAIKRDRTVIIISHSISQIIDSDMVYALPPEVSTSTNLLTHSTPPKSKNDQDAPSPSHSSPLTLSLRLLSFTFSPQKDRYVRINTYLCGKI